MKKSISSCLFVCFMYTTFGQPLSADNLLTITSLSASRAKKFILHKGFSPAGMDQTEGKTQYYYDCKIKKCKTFPDSIERQLSNVTKHNERDITYKTSSLEEFTQLRNQLLMAGFISHQKPDSLGLEPAFLQYDDISVYTFVGTGTDFTKPVYIIRMVKKKLPSLKEIYYAEDLLAFDSHVNLQYIFGKENVRKDLYYFTDKEFNKCSVLFPNTERQAVFIWQDEKNECRLQNILLGGQLALKSSAEYEWHVAENSWLLKNKVRAGMNLRQLRWLNGSDFRFYNINSVYSGMIIPGSQDNIDFGRGEIILGCMNCTEIEEADHQIISADEAIAAGKSFFVFMIMLYPSGYHTKMMAY